MRNKHDGSILCIIQCFQNDAFVDAVQIAGRLIQKHERCIGKKGARQRDALLFAARKRIPQFADTGIVAMGQGGNKIMDRCLFRRSDDFLVRCAQIGNADIVADGIMKQVRFLRTIAFVFTQGFCVDVCDIRSGKQNPATVLIPEAHNKLQKGGFATLDNFLTVYHFFHITVYISKGFLLKHKKCTYFSCNSFYNLQNEKHNKQSYNRQPNAGIKHTNKHRNNSKYRGNKLC